MEGPDDKPRMGRSFSIWLDEYDDIFSDFDPRPYSERALSDDFINEVRKVSTENSFNIWEVKLLVPEKSRKMECENIIIHRLHVFFKDGNNLRQKQAGIDRTKGIIMGVAGICMMLIASHIAGRESDKFIMKLLLVLFEPAGWF